MRDFDPDDVTPCRWCAEPIARRAVVCQHCGHDQNPWLRYSPFAISLVSLAVALAALLYPVLVDRAEARRVAEARQVTRLGVEGAIEAENDTHISVMIRNSGTVTAQIHTQMDCVMTDVPQSPTMRLRTRETFVRVLSDGDAPLRIGFALTGEDGELVPRDQVFERLVGFGAEAEPEAVLLACELQELSVKGAFREPIDDPLGLRFALDQFGAVTVQP